MKVDTLFIGGCVDGKRMAIDEGIRHYQIPVPLSIEDITVANPVATTTEWKTELYRSEQLREGEHKYTIMVSNSIPMGKVIATLIDGYRK